MSQYEDSSIQQKQAIIQEEIINKNYDKDRFLQYCIDKKEGGNDLNNWSLRELNDVIIEFTNLENAAAQENAPKEGNFFAPSNQNVTQGEKQPIKENIPSSNEPLIPGKKKEINLDLEKINNASMIEQTELNKYEQKEFTCKKLEKSVINDKAITVEIKNPKTVGRTLFESSYVTYEIITEQMNWNVRRRFSDFVWLRTTLVKFFPRLMIPPIPGKKLGSRRFEDDYIKKRMKFLQKFIDATIKSEELKASEALVSFLSMADRNQFESKMKELTSYQPSPYLEDLKTLSGKLKVEYNESNEKYFLNIYNYFRLQGQLFERLNYNMKNFYNSMTDAITNIQEVQKDFETLHLLNSKISMKQEITKTVEELGIFFKNWKRILYHQNEIIREDIRHFFKYLKMEGDSFGELINSREALNSRYKSEKASLMAKKEKLWNNKNPATWGIDDIYSLDSGMLVQNKEYALGKMCSKETQNLENLHKQLGYANKMNGEQLKTYIENNIQRYVDKVKEFAERFYPTLSDSISVWSSLNSYL